MSAWARPGVKCVCIKDDWLYDVAERMGLNPPHRVPMIREVLTVKEVVHIDQFMGSEIPGGASLSFHEMGHDWGFAVANFKPLITGAQEQDVSLFTHHLDGVGVGA